MSPSAQLMPCERQRGFSLVELMIAMTIGFIVLAGIGYLYVESRQAFRSMDNLSRMQESARYALEIMSRDIRMAGYRGCASSSGDFNNTLNNSGTTAYNFGLPINGYDGGGVGWTPALPADTGGLNFTNPPILAGTDAIILRGAFGGGVTVTKEPGKTSADIKVTAPNDLEPGDIVMVTNCKAASVLQITAPYGKGEENVVHNTGAGTPGNSTKDLVENYSKSGGELIKMQSKSYFIRNGASGRPALWQFDNYKPVVNGVNPAEITEGVENMQILYGIDPPGAPEGVVESYVKADAVTDWNQVAAVRISLLVTGNDDNVATSKQKYNYNGALVEAPDRRLRQVFTSTISVRNKTQ
ncbi:MAG: PilW family protein [Thiobacillus sp.]|nr:PilW family protein [Thiobacillus sp.]